MWTYYAAWLTVGIIGAVGAVVYQHSEGLQMLYAFHRVKENNAWKGVQKTVQSVMWMGYLLVYQKVAKNLVLWGKNEYDVHYVLGNRLYKIRTFSKKGPYCRKVLQVIDEDQNDVTVDVQSYLGPREDWHGLLYDPSQLRYKSLTFNMADGNSLTFENQQPIRL